jgi:hypothetical protein
MRAESLGLIAADTPGAPVPLTTDRGLMVARLRVQQPIGETGRVWLGDENLDTVSGAGVIAEFWPTGVDGGRADAFEICAADGSNSIRPSDYYVDAGIEGEGVIAAYWVR